jgi:hypothetical protein
MMDTNLLIADELGFDRQDRDAGNLIVASNQPNLYPWEGTHLAST